MLLTSISNVFLGLLAEGVSFVEALPDAVDKALRNFDGNTKPTLAYVVMFKSTARHTTVCGRRFVKQFTKSCPKEAAAAWMRLYELRFSRPLDKQCKPQGLLWEASRTTATA